MQPRTKRQKEVLEYITDFIEDHGYQPSYQQIALHFGVKSKGGIAKHVESLEKQGLIRRKRDAAGFHLELMSEVSINNSVSKIEWLKLPETTEDEATPDLFVPLVLLKTHHPDNIRAFRVPDDSMLDNHICAGDIALVEKRTAVRDRDCIVALIDKKKAVLKTFHRFGADIELRSANDEFETIKISGDRMKVLGVFRGLLRPAIY